MVADPICEECNNSIYSEVHMRGVGLHGHVSFSEEETRAQRAEHNAAAGLPPPAAPAAKTLSQMNKTELLEIAEAEGITDGEDLTVKSLAEAIREARKSRAGE